MNLDELQAVCDAATPGDWAFYGMGDNTDKCVIEDMRYCNDLFMTCEDSHRQEADAHFVVIAKIFMPKLIAELKEARQTQKAFEQILTECMQSMQSRSCHDKLV